MTGRARHRRDGLNRLLANAASGFMGHGVGMRSRHVRHRWKRRRQMLGTVNDRAFGAQTHRLNHAAITVRHSRQAVGCSITPAWAASLAGTASDGSEEPMARSGCRRITPNWQINAIQRDEAGAGNRPAANPATSRSERPAPSEIRVFAVKSLSHLGTNGTTTLRWRRRRALEQRSRRNPGRLRPATPAWPSRRRCRTTTSAGKSLAGANPRRAVRVANATIKINQRRRANGPATTRLPLPVSAQQNFRQPTPAGGDEPLGCGWRRSAARR